MFRVRALAYGDRVRRAFTLIELVIVIAIIAIIAAIVIPNIADMPKHLQPGARITVVATDKPGIIVERVGTEWVDGSDGKRHYEYVYKVRVEGDAGPVEVRYFEHELRSAPVQRERE